MRSSLLLVLVACGSSTTTSTSTAVAPVAASPQLAAPMAKLGFMRGVWRGEARGVTLEGTPYTVTQTERMGPMLGGDIVVIEGRGYKPDGTTGFNAFAVASWNPFEQRYELRSYAQGMAGTFELVLTGTGYTWEIPAGPDAKIKFTATVGADTWREVGEYIASGQPPRQTFEMNLRRVGETDWPLGAPIAPR
jgi:hypothetical protein